MLEEVKSRVPLAPLLAGMAVAAPRPSKLILEAGETSRI